MKPAFCRKRIEGPEQRSAAGKRIFRSITAAALVAATGLICSGALASSAAPGPSNPSDLPIAAPMQLAQAVPVSPPPLQAPEHTGWIDWNGDSFLWPCHGDCAISIYSGQEVTTSMTQIFFVEYPAKPLWKWHWRNSDLAAMALSRRLVTFWDALSLEPEAGIGQRFGQMHATEFWGAINFRWTEFPWNNYVKTSVAIADGLSVVSQTDAKELTLNSPRAGSHFLNFFSPSVTFALPEYPAYELMIRWHHRSGVFGLINGVHKGAQFLTAGIRVDF